MGWFSCYGIGATIHRVQSSGAGDGRVEFTSWLSILWIPIIPLRSWSAIYVGETLPDAISGEGQAFVDLKRIQHDLSGLVQTFARGIFALTVAVLPCAYMLYRTDGRAATIIEMIFIFAFTIWPVALVIYTDNCRKAKLRAHINGMHAEPPTACFHVEDQPREPGDR
ncbi:hypothetical protein [Gimesia fumaroli]|uniref:Uncharacterized protein n=1 Tax=Gimesia fumaroli TaxID=2527976 RepID=A0A518ICP4_9PLAN|nr:hypothetical protein [Gimesia fumaroli]QDV50876.1 hypothetical protein Enr17x_29210 [Gimesia fumaroli]